MPGVPFRVLQKGTTMQNGICVNCNAASVYTKRNMFHNPPIPVSFFAGANLDIYVCTNCAYVEWYVAEDDVEAGVLEKIEDKWDKVQPEQQ